MDIETNFQRSVRELGNNHPVGLTDIPKNFRSAIYSNLALYDPRKLIGEGRIIVDNYSDDKVSLTFTVSTQDGLIYVRSGGKSKEKGSFLDRNTYEVPTAVEIVLDQEGNPLYEAYWLQGAVEGRLDIYQIVDQNSIAYLATILPRVNDSENRDIINVPNSGFTIPVHTYPNKSIEKVYF